jgi:hypothetical protein
MALYTLEKHLLGYKLLIRTNDQSLGQLISRELNSCHNKLKTPCLATLAFDLLIAKNQPVGSSKKSTLTTQYDDSKERLSLFLPRGIGRAEVDYQSNKVCAQLSPAALQYLPVLFNWIITIPLAELLKKWHYFFLHAAALARDDQGVLFAGKSRSGKSTLALLLLSQGWHLITDDEAFLTKEENYQVYGFSAQAKLTPATWQRHASILGAPPDSKNKISVDLAKIFPTQIQPTAKLAAICLIAPSKKLTLQRLAPIDALPQLLNLCFLPAHPRYTRASFAFLCDLADQLPIYRLSFNLESESLDRLLRQEIISPNG